MGRLYFEDDEGRRIPIRSVEGVSGGGAIMLKTSVRICPDVKAHIEQEVERKLGCPVVVLDGYIKEVLRLDGGD